MAHTRVIYEDNIETIGVQSVYVYSDLQYQEEMTTYSDIVTLDIASGEVSGIQSIQNVQTVVNTEYYTLSGQKVKNPENGIYIMRSTLKDGSILVKKVIR